ncbi:hypothetical protein [Pseudoclavibacter helvolus]|uniref:hypothetical protein n=1 Tax=Pseudoclavibacter helvolus TaxID=255205 RepID=UPI003C74F3AF
MTDQLDLPAPEKLTPALESLRDRAQEADLPVDICIDRQFSDGRVMLGVYIDFPCDRLRRTVRIPEDHVDDLLEDEFENIHLLDDLAAFYDPMAGAITAFIDNPVRSRRLTTLPGVEFKTSELDYHLSQHESPKSRQSHWRLELTDHQSNLVVEFLPGSALASAVLEHPAGHMVRITGANELTHDTARELLEETIHRISFDFDVAYGLPLRIPRRYRRRELMSSEDSTKVPEFPRNEYAAEALHLYQYGRQGGQLPTLEFLAYYQSVEYFFSYFARARAVHDLRSTILDPAFDPSTDRDITRLLALAGAGDGSQSERQQLRATIQSCVREDQLVEFLSADEVRLKALTKEKKIRGAEKLSLNNQQSDVREQFANRVYAIRCRIVHSKMDGGGYEDVLLPTGPEAAALEHDIDMLRFVAQRVLIARATRY